MSELVFVYGTLKRDGPNHGYIVHSNGNPIADTWLSGWRMLDVGAFPTAVEATEDHKIYGEIYLVELLDVIDILEGYPSFYNRKKVKTEIGDVWIYYQNNPFGPEVPSGVWDNSRLNNSSSECII